MEERREERYFAASNSGKGFISYFGEIFSPEKFEKVYIIKGGPGTGKSYFMRAVATEAEKCGRAVKYYYCSSDQHSLDGIIIDDAIAIIDGTAPHSAECLIPGAVENIIDLGRFWNSGLLCGRRSDIEHLNIEKKRSYKRAYSFLSAYDNVTSADNEILSPKYDRIKAERYILGQLKPKNSDRRGFNKTVALRDSVGMGGRVIFDTLEARAKKVIKVDNSLGAAYLLLDSALRIAESDRLSITVSYDPVSCEHIDAILFDTSGLLFEASNIGRVKMSRFIQIDADEKGRIKASLGLRSALMSEALDALACVRQTHFELEAIYESAMDFAAKEQFTSKFIKALLLQ